MTAVPLWGPRDGRPGPVHRAQDAPHNVLSWCGARAQFRHRHSTGTLDDVTCPKCLRRMDTSDRPMARGARA